MLLARSSVFKASMSAHAICAPLGPWTMAGCAAVAYISCGETGEFIGEKIIGPAFNYTVKKVGQAINYVFVDEVPAALIKVTPYGKLIEWSNDIERIENPIDRIRTIDAMFGIPSSFGPIFPF